MTTLLFAVLGAIGLSFVTTLYHRQLFPDIPSHETWLFHTIPTGLLLGFATPLALRARVGVGKALRCFAASVLGLVPLAVRLWLQVTVDPIHLIPLLVQGIVQFAPTLVWTTVLALIGLVNLRPARFRHRSPDEEN